MIARTDRKKSPCDNVFPVSAYRCSPLRRAITTCRPKLKPKPSIYIARNHIPASADAPNSTSPTCPKNKASVMFISCSIRMLIITGKAMSHIFLYV